MVSNNIVPAALARCGRPVHPGRQRVACRPGPARSARPSTSSHSGRSR
jgi:hypothetical protein